jgi:hypothetical protein
MEPELKEVRAVLPVASTPQALLCEFAEKASAFCAAHPGFHAFFSFTSAFDSAAGRRFFKVETGDTATPAPFAPVEQPANPERTAGAKRRLIPAASASAPSPAFTALTNPNTTGRSLTKRATSAPSVDLDALQKEIDEKLGTPVRPPPPPPLPLALTAKSKTALNKTCIWVHEGTACTGSIAAFCLCRKHFQTVPVVQQSVHRALFELMAFSVNLLTSHKIAFCAGPTTARNMALFKGPAPWTSSETLLVARLESAVLTSADLSATGFVLVRTSATEYVLTHASAPGETWKGKTPSLTWIFSKLPTKGLGGDAYGPVTDVKRLELEDDTKQIVERFGEHWHCDIEVDEAAEGFAARVPTAPYAYTHMARSPLPQALTSYFAHLKSGAATFKSSFDGSFACLNSQPLLDMLQADFNATPYAAGTGISLALAAEPPFEADTAETLVLPTFAFCTLPAVSPHYLGTQPGKDAAPRDRRTVVQLFTASATGPRLDAIALVRLVSLPACTTTKLPTRAAPSDEVKAADELRRFSAEALGGTETLMFLVDVLTSRPGTKAGKTLLQSLWKAIGARFTSPAKPVLMTLSFTNAELSKLYCGIDIEDGKSFAPTSLSSSAPFLVFHRTTHVEPPDAAAAAAPAAAAAAAPAEVLRISSTAGLCKTNPCLPTAMEAWKQRVGGVVEAHEALKNALATALKTPATFVSDAGAAVGKAAAATCALADTLISTSSNRCAEDIAAEYDAAIKRSIAASCAHVVSTLCASSPHIVETAFKSPDMWTAASTAFHAALPALKTTEAERLLKRKAAAELRAQAHGLQARA